jgi:hypothetical protein
MSLPAGGGGTYVGDVATTATSGIRDNTQSFGGVNIGGFDWGSGLAYTNQSTPLTVAASQNLKPLIYGALLLGGVWLITKRGR